MNRPNRLFKNLLFISVGSFFFFILMLWMTGRGKGRGRDKRLNWDVSFPERRRKKEWVWWFCLRIRCQNKNYSVTPSRDIKRRCCYALCITSLTQLHLFIHSIIHSSIRDRQWGPLGFLELILIQILVQWLQIIRNLDFMTHEVWSISELFGTAGLNGLLVPHPAGRSWLAFTEVVSLNPG